MTEISAGLVKELRELTGLGMMECKKALAEGAVSKFLGEKTLLGQPFVRDDKQSVEKMLAAKKAKVNGYAFFVVGEGIEKKQTDFAAEVMAQAGRAHRHLNTNGSSSSCRGK